MNPFYSMRARYFLIVFTLLVLIERMGKQVLGNTFHISLSFFTSILVLYVFPSVWLFYQCKRHRVPFTVFMNRRESFNFLQVLMITGMLCLFSYGYLVLYMYSFAWITPNFIIDILNEPIIGNAGGYISQYIIIVLVAPIICEFVFRGFLFQRFAAKWGTGKGMIVAAILFGCFHIDFLGAVVFSIVLTIVYMRTKSLLMPITIHMLNNATVLITSFMVSKEEKMSLADFSTYTPFLTGLIIFIIGLNFVLVFLFMNRRYMSKEVPVVYANKIREL
ncbi:CPBP family intramembrane metalloprotease [Bacillus sp. Xin]|uniref:CPBP family intramembrane glutamic endopeptidase n=1 Tax=unclassified Bacillus (in: firmicutes) TaxID=185979 RepID=UPI001574C1DA|nr:MULTISPECIES: type II CAAX endopeptidase family protein [unclassified Bacillus (in: firmicutes)]MBC6971474.1 CPBP family intramembrane metalloprotease [Bacillus sp. Xin]NSW38579.1 CPBP family intramembrane metalloprotease [Bacillus sp. Xin1]